jgi:hypothetical protein
MTKSKRIRQVENVPSIRNVRNVYKILIEKLQRKSTQKTWAQMGG